MKARDRLSEVSDRSEETLRAIADEMRVDDITTEQGLIISDAKGTGLEGSVLQVPGDEAYVVKRAIEGFDVYAILPKATGRSSNGSSRPSTVRRPSWS